MRVAYFSPLPPLHTGIADYSSELIAELGRHVDLELVVDRGYRPDREISDRYAVTEVREFLRRPVEERGDIALYHLGNHAPFHGYVYESLFSWPGVVVLHEVMIHRLIRGLTFEANKPLAYVEEMGYCAGASAAAVARREVRGGIGFDVWRYPLFEHAIDASRSVIVHGDYARRRVLASRPTAHVRVVPHHLSLPSRPSAEATAVRERYGVPPDALLIASFGLATAQKRLDRALAAVKRLRRKLPHVMYMIGGEVAPDPGLARMLEDAASEGVIVTGRLPLADMLDLMESCDIALNLRFPTGGETSGTLIRLLGLGKPVVVNDVGAFSDIPDDCCVKVEIDGFESEVFYALLCRLAFNPGLRRRIGENARRWVRETHSIERSVAGYLAALEEALSLPNPEPPAPPLTPYEPSDWATRLSAAVGSELADLGIGEDDPLLESLGTDINDLVGG